MFKLLNLVKSITVVIQFKNNINSDIYRQVVLLQVYLIKVSEGTACVTWNEEYVKFDLLVKQKLLMSHSGMKSKVRGNSLSVVRLR